MVNDYCKNQADALISNINLVDSYTKTEIYTQLTDYTTITYLQGSYMTSISIAETLMNNYATITLLDDYFDDKTYLDNQFSLSRCVTISRFIINWLLRFKIY